MDWSVGSPRTRSVVGVYGPGVSVFGSPALKQQHQYFAQVQGEMAITKRPLCYFFVYMLQVKINFRLK